MFELYQLEQLLVVSECGTLSQAAEQLHLSQSALSRSMQRLKAELQVTLFTRQKNRIELNECGRMAVEHARRIVEQARDMAFHIQAFDRSQRTILVGSCAPAPPVGDPTPAVRPVSRPDHLLRTAGTRSAAQRAAGGRLSTGRPPLRRGGSRAGLYLI